MLGCTIRAIYQEGCLVALNSIECQSIIEDMGLFGRTQSNTFTQDPNRSTIALNSPYTTKYLNTILTITFIEAK